MCEMPGMNEGRAAFLSRHRFFRVPLPAPWLAAVLLSSWALSCHAGGGPENVFVVVNTSSPDSLAVANAFVALRSIPPINVLAIAWDGPDDAVPISVFRERILGPVLTAIDTRGLATQIDCIAYSCGFPWRIDFHDDLPESLVGRDKYPAGSLTGMTFLFSATVEPPVGSIPRWLGRHTNRYAPPPATDGAVATTRGFRAATGWGPEGEPAAAGGSHHVLAVMLGVTAGRGNSVDEIVTSLVASTAADGSRPTGTIFFLTNSDVRTTTRSAGFPAAVAAIQAAGATAKVITGTLPREKADVAGLMTGAAEFDWAASGSRLLPGAICDNLTSFGGVFSPGAEQTPLSEFVRAGAAGASGTVIEPYALADKFPTPALHLHYVRGACLAEAFYRSVRSPYQLLVVGDPLCQPWAHIPAVDVTVADAQSGEPLDLARPLAGSLAVTRHGNPTGTAPIGRYDMFVDGIRIASCREGDHLPLDTGRFSDGHHELRIVAIDSSPLETQGRWVRDVTFANHGHRLIISAEPRHVSMGGSLRITISGTPADSVTVFTAGRVLGRVTADENPLDTSLNVAATDLGPGDVMLHATAHLAGVAVANAAPVTVTVTKQPSATLTPQAGDQSR
jgi:hypothetical protein